MLATPLLVIALSGCIKPEVGIDRTRVVGTVRVEAQAIDETGEIQNGSLTNPILTDPLSYGYRALRGVITTSEIDDAGEPTDAADTDNWSLNTPVPRGQGEEGGLAALDIDITLGDATSRARIAVYNLDDTSAPNQQPQVVASQDFGGWALFTVQLNVDTNYAISVTGLEGPPNTTYEMFMLGQDPNDAGLLVGAYEKDTPKDRGVLYAGSNAKDFKVVEDLAFEGWYEMLFVRQYTTGERDDRGKLLDGEADVLDEGVKSGFIYAGDWANLSQTLPAGTWYSRRPVPVNFNNISETVSPGQSPHPDTGVDPSDVSVPLIRDIPTYPTVLVSDSVVPNAIAPVVIGIDHTELEPNDVSVDVGSFAMDMATADGAEDIGSLSGPGFVDILRGSIDFADTSEGYVHDVDAFKFTVPSTVDMYFNMSWAGASDLDMIVFDAGGIALDWAASLDNPELTGGYWIFEPGETYYLAVLGYLDADAPTAPEYELQVEQLAR